MKATANEVSPLGRALNQLLASKPRALPQSSFIHYKQHMFV